MNLLDFSHTEKPKNIFWSTQYPKSENKKLNKSHFQGFINSQYFFMKISWIGPWVNRIDWCEGHFKINWPLQMPEDKVLYYLECITLVSHWVRKGVVATKVIIIFFFDIKLDQQFQRRVLDINSAFDFKKEASLLLTTV